MDDGEHIVNKWSTFLASGESLDVGAALRRANGEYRRLPPRQFRVHLPTRDWLPQTFLLSPATEER
jgi:hypothetical protein